VIQPSSSFFEIIFSARLGPASPRHKLSPADRSQIEVCVPEYESRSLSSTSFGILVASLKISPLLRKNTPICSVALWRELRGTSPIDVSPDSFVEKVTQTPLSAVDSLSRHAHLHPRRTTIRHPASYADGW
jgi:hypothetical protein